MTWQIESTRSYLRQLLIDAGTDAGDRVREEQPHPVQGEIPAALAIYAEGAQGITTRQDAPRAYTFPATYSIEGFVSDEDLSVGTNAEARPFYKRRDRLLRQVEAALLPRLGLDCAPGRDPCTGAEITVVWPETRPVSIELGVSDAGRTFNGAFRMVVQIAFEVVVDEGVASEIGLFERANLEYDVGPTAGIDAEDAIEIPQS